VVVGSGVEVGRVSGWGVLVGSGVAVGGSDVAVGGNGVDVEVGEAVGSGVEVKVGCRVGVEVRMSGTTVTGCGNCV
jgi:hypothetical protein